MLVFSYRKWSAVNFMVCKLLVVLWMRSALYVNNMAV